MAADTYKAIWTEITERVKEFEDTDPTQTAAFFKRLHLQAFSDGYLMLTAENDFTKNWIESHYLDYIGKALKDIYGMPFTVAIEVDTSIVSEIPLPTQENVRAQRTSKKTEPTIDTPDTRETNTHNPEESDKAKPSPAPLKEPAPAPAPQKQKKGLSSTLTFDNFVVGGSNNMAYSMALNVAEAPVNSQFNPLFIYGRSGLGKTHLLRAIQNYIDDVYPELKTVYVDANELAADYSEAGRNKSFDEFHSYYDTADVLLIDDMQNIKGKEGTIEQLFTIFNKMLESGRQVILAADRAPKAIEVDERSTTRWNSGITCDIQPPELETKIGIIKNCIDNYRQRNPRDAFEINSDVQEYIAQTSGSNIRELISGVNKVIVDCVDNKGTSVKRAALLLQDHFHGGSRSKTTVEDIQAAVEDYYGVSHGDLVGKKRTATISHARQMAIYLCRTMLDIPFKAIGEAFNRDHSTAMHSHNLISQKVQENIEISTDLEKLREKVSER